MLAFGLMFGLLVGMLTLQVLAVWLLARGFAVPKASLPRAAGFIVAQAVLHVGFVVVQARLPEGGPAIWVALAVELLLLVWLIRAFFQGTARQTGAILGSLLLLGMGALAFSWLVYRPYVAETFVVPTNSMAPTLLGWHRQGTCPTCGGAMAVTAAPPSEPLRNEDPLAIEEGICTVCRKVTGVTPDSAALLPRDHFLVDKLRTPGRWDMITFYVPDASEQLYVKRVVGMPGETVYVAEGQVWINGAPLALPPELAGLEYRLPEHCDPFFPYGREESPCRLAGDEYFVLGDFSVRSRDSRAWGPVPAANYVGVVAGRYWPLSRFVVW